MAIDSDVVTGPAAEAAAQPAARLSLRQARRLLRRPAVLVPTSIIVIVAVVAIFAPLLSPADPNTHDLGRTFRPVGTPGHLLGTDNLGRDELSCVLWGARRSLVAGLVPAVVSVVVGGVIGLLSGYIGGVLDAVIMRMMDIVMSFPLMILAIALVASLGASLQNAMIAATLIALPGAARLIRGDALVLKQATMAHAARLLGYGRLRIVFFEILPHLIPLAISLITIDIAWMILATSGLSFLGLGSPPPDAEWGLMIGEGKAYLTEAPHLTIVPGIAISVTVVAFSMLGDAIQDILNPRHRLT